MIEEPQTKKYKMEEIRKKYPKAGMRWAADEDEKLKKLYEDNRTSGGDFEVFLEGLIKDFGRAAGGLKARLAMHFDDVPGWDYQRQNDREDILNKQVEEKFTSEKDEMLFRSYKSYVQAKRETYMAFLKRMSTMLGGIEGKYITHRLSQLVGTIEKYGKDDVDPFSRRRALSEGGPDGAIGGEDGVEEDISQYDFSHNSQAQEALRIMDQTSQNLFLTGEAGTGKSTLLKYFRLTTDKNVVVLAPTGVAALNVEGQTIHSFCAFGPDITVQKVKKLGPWSPKLKLLQKVQTIIIDEISMVRADLLDCVDKFLRLNGPEPKLPFGGIQMIFIGDLFQLPPVEKDFIAGDGLIKLYNSPYFFDSLAFKQSRFYHVKLETMYRQRDQVFIDVLNAVRNNVATQEHLQILNQRSQDAGSKFTFEQFAIYLVPTNARARTVNNFFLEKINAPLKTYQGIARGKFEDRELPTDLDLQIKIGAQVMMLNNDPRKRWVNGTMGKIVGIESGGGGQRGVSGSFSPLAGEMPKLDEAERVQSSGEAVEEKENLTYQYEYDPYDEDSKSPSTDAIVIELETGETVYVTPHTWEMYQFALNKFTQHIDSKTVGTYTQYPFKLAWAVTIHKAQGKTFDKVYIDLSTGTFAHGQLYVALSRCRTLQGLYLKRPIIPQDILLDSRIVQFLSDQNPRRS